jgi:hypothetical protein
MADGPVIITWNAANWITISLMFIVLIFALGVGIKIKNTWGSGQ